MDYRDSPEQARLRAEVREFVSADPAVRARAFPEDGWIAGFDPEFSKRLAARGWLGMTWPKQYGGRERSYLDRLIVTEELLLAGAPVAAHWFGDRQIGPALLAHGTPEQKAELVPRIARAEISFCIGMSEPDAGSDLAALNTRADLDGDEFVIRGQKIWTSFAHVADYCEMLVRTDPEVPKHRGITWLIMPMDAPGIDIRPLRTMEGSTEFCEMFLDEVRVPVANRVGAENDGWRVAMVTLSFERGTAFVSEMLQTMELCRDLAALAKKITRQSATAWEDQGFQRDLGRLAAELDALWAQTKRNISEATRKGLVGVGGNVFKLAYTDLRHRLGELALHLLERASLSLDDVGELPTGEHVHGRIHGLSMTIAAGTSQVQKNIVAERVLGLPKDR